MANNKMTKKKVLKTRLVKEDIKRKSARRAKSTPIVDKSFPNQNEDNRKGIEALPVNYVEGNNFGPYWGSIQDEVHPFGDQLTDEFTSTALDENGPPVILLQPFVLSAEDYMLVEVVKCSQCHLTADNQNTLEEHFLANHKENDSSLVKKQKERKEKPKRKSKNKDSPLKLKSKKSKTSESNSPQDGRVTKMITMRTNSKKYKITIVDLGKGEKKFNCETCTKSYKTMNILRMHIKDAHILNSNFECNVCFKKFFTSSSLNHHVLADHLGVRSVHTCSECGKDFDRVSSMKQHMSEVHLKERNFKCAICHKTYPRNSYLLRHIRSVHEGHKISHEDRTPCSECDRDFYNKWTLNKHIREVHLKLKPFKCKICSESFVRSNHLQAHVERIHTNGENGKSKKDGAKKMIKNDKKVSKNRAKKETQEILFIEVMK